MERGNLASVLFYTYFTKTLFDRLLRRNFISPLNDEWALTFLLNSNIIPLMQKFVKDAITMLSKELSEKFDDFHGLYLYGAFADGTNESDDDVELVAIFDAEDKAKREVIWPIVGKVETELDVYIDLHPYTMDDLKKDEEFYDEVVNKGIFFENEKKE